MLYEVITRFLYQDRSDIGIQSENAVMSFGNRVESRDSLDAGAARRATVRRRPGAFPDIKSETVPDLWTIILNTQSSLR